MNLCAHSETRIDLVRILMGMLTLDVRKPLNHIDTSEPLYRLYACQSNVMYSRPQFFDGDVSLSLSLHYKITRGLNGTASPFD